MSKLSLVQKIIAKNVDKLDDVAAKATLERVSEARSRDLSPAAEAFNTKKWEVLKAKDNMKLMNAAEKESALLKSKNIERFFI